MNEISTAGVAIKYAVETTAGTRPTTFSTSIPNVKSIGSLNPEPTTYDATDLSDTEWKRNLIGLKDIGGAISLTVNVCNSFITAWDTLVSAAETAEASSKATWFEVSHPKLTKKFYFSGMPSAFGLPEIGTDAIYEGEAYIVPQGFDGWQS